MDARELMALVEVEAADPAVLAAYEQIAARGRSTRPILIYAPTGAGKERAGRAAHVASRRPGPRIDLNCAAIAEALLESELFGHEKGAFTGAARQKRGLFELAEGGTLFLDEIGEVPIALQAKLLRVLQEGEIRRVGGEVTVRVDVRVVAASNRDLRVEVAEGRFREDLLYRLGSPVELPALRDRTDLELVAADRLAAVWRDQGRDGEPPALAAEVLEALYGRDWPGNVRELEDALDVAVALRGEEPIRVEDVAGGDGSRSRVHRVPMQGASGSDAGCIGTRCTTPRRIARPVLAQRARLALDETGLSERQLAAALDWSTGHVRRFRSTSRPAAADVEHVLERLGYEITVRRREEGPPGTPRA